MTDAVRLVLVGCGRQMGQNLVPFLQRLQGYRVLACVDDNPALARAMQVRTGAAHAVTDVAELSLNDVDAAILAVPPEPSSALTRFFVDRGVHCFVEKPAGESTAVLATLDAAVRQSAAQVQVGFNFRYAEALQQLHGLTRATRTVPAIVSTTFFSRHPETPQWGVDNTVEAWIRQNGVHAIDLARWFLPAPVTKIDVHAIRRDADHFFATILLRHADGSLSVLRVGNHTMKFVVEMSVQGSDGSIFTAPSLEQVLLEMDAGTPSRALLHTTRNLDHGWARSGFGPELEAFLAACRSPGSGPPDRPSITDALEASRICDRVMAQLGAETGHGEPAPDFATADSR